MTYIAWVFLFFSLRRLFRKINVGDSQETSQPGPAATPGRDSDDAT
jgi:hypothetical protein